MNSSSLTSQIIFSLLSYFSGLEYLFHGMGALMQFSTLRTRDDISLLVNQHPEFLNPSIITPDFCQYVSNQNRTIWELENGLRITRLDSVNTLSIQDTQPFYCPSIHSAGLDLLSDPSILETANVAIQSRAISMTHKVLY